MKKPAYIVFYLRKGGENIIMSRKATKKTKTKKSVKKTTKKRTCRRK